ncbi:MAG: PD-(D/E)XK nuclease family protein [Kaiparowitsia implicata GSE-PSE-MK54-09C]|jgi:hypothetical protein|nr:PD-(D/E)XK nuclease family protein [Kaiparowitsia implicata GSE-PSE-MK54-09C]
MEYNLLSSLRKYRPRENQDPLENFITEAFAWLLKNNKNFSDSFLRKILIRLHPYSSSGLDLQLNLDCKWATQMNFGGIFPDMVAELNDGTLLVFEHKVWAQLHPGQLDSYKQFSSVKYSHSYLILITANESQHLQDPDLALCWRDVYTWTQEWLQSEEEKPDFIFLDFLNLLREEGLGPVAPVSHNSILSYYSARNFKEQVIDLVKQAAKRDWHQIDSRISIDNELRRGKVVYEMSGRVALLLLTNGCPSLTTGFILDWEGYHIPPILGVRSPDFSVFLRFSDFRNEYPNMEVYRDFVKILRTKIELLDDGWFFYDYLNDPQVSEKSSWLPIHIRKPMLELLCGTTNSEEQVDRFMQANELILTQILECQEFWKLREIFKQKSDIAESSNELAKPLDSE